MSNLNTINPNSHLESSIYTGGRKTESRDLSDTQLVLGFEGLPYMQDEFYTAQILAIILGGGMSSRLFQNIREKLGVCYSIYSFHWGFSDSGVFAISASTNKKHLNIVIGSIVDELKSLTNHIDEAELKRAVSQYKATLIMSQESSSARAPAIARQLLTRGCLISNQEIFDKVDAIDLTKLKIMAEKIFFTKRHSLAAVGPVDELMSDDELQSIIKY